MPVGWGKLSPGQERKRREPGQRQRVTRGNFRGRLLPRAAYMAQSPQFFKQIVSGGGYDIHAPMVILTPKQSADSLPISSKPQVVHTLGSNPFFG